MDNFLDGLKKYFENTPEDVIKETWAKYDTKENNIGATMDDFLKDNSLAESGKSHRVDMREIFKHFGVINDDLKQQKKEREELWSAWRKKSCTKITGKQFRQVVGNPVGRVRVVISSYVENGKGCLIQGENEIILQINQVTTDLLLQQKDSTEVLDSLELTILPIDYWAIDNSELHL